MRPLISDSIVGYVTAYILSRESFKEFMREPTGLNKMAWKMWFNVEQQFSRKLMDDWGW